MTITIERKTINDNVIAEIEISKEGEHKLLIYRKTDSNILQNSDIIVEKSYYCERSARNAMNRYAKKIKEGSV